MGPGGSGTGFAAFDRLRALRSFDFAGTGRGTGFPVRTRNCIKGRAEARSAALTTIRYVTELDAASPSGFARAERPKERGLARGAKGEFAASLSTIEPVSRFLSTGSGAALLRRAGCSPLGERQRGGLSCLNFPTPFCTVSACFRSTGYKAAPECAKAFPTRRLKRKGPPPHEERRPHLVAFRKSREEFLWVICQRLPRVDGSHHRQ